MPSGVPLNDTISSHFTVPSPGAVNDKLRAFFDQWYFGEGSPEGVVTAPTGSLYLQKNGTTQVVWQKQSGSGNTGWGALGTGTSVEHSNQSGAAYTLALGDAGKVVRATNAGAVTITVPANATVAFAVGTIVNVYAAGAGGVTIAAAGGVTIRNNAAPLVQYQEVSLRKDLADEWVRLG